MRSKTKRRERNGKKAKKSARRWSSRKRFLKKEGEDWKESETRKKWASLGDVTGKKKGETKASRARSEDHKNKVERQTITTVNPRGCWVTASMLLNERNDKTKTNVLWHVVDRDGTLLNFSKQLANYFLFFSFRCHSRVRLQRYKPWGVKFYCFISVVVNVSMIARERTRELWMAILELLASWSFSI